jgi:hypothetical protein
VSRSYKKHPVCKDGESGYPGKSFANRRVRRYRGYLASGGAYKKLFCPYDIHDQWSMQTFEKHMKWEWDYYRLRGQLLGQKEPDEREEFRSWIRFFRNK